MNRNILIGLLFILTVSSCRSQQNQNQSKLTQTSDVKSLDLGIEELTLTSLSKDSNEVHIELGLPSGDYLMFYFKKIDESLMNPIEKIRGLYIEVKALENNNSPTSYLDSLKAVNYHSYAFEVNKNDWDTIKSKAKRIELIADTAYRNFYCEFCSHYTLGYNGKMIEDKLTQNKDVESFFNFLVDKYRDKLYATKKTK